MSHEALSDEQFSPHGKGFYQPPLPGMEAEKYPHPGSREVPVESIFKHPRIESHRREYSLTQWFNPKIKNVRTTALRPTQDIVDEGTIHKAPEGVAEREHPGVIKDTKGRYRIVDGHHRVARALLEGKKTIPVQMFDARWR